MASKQEKIIEKKNRLELYRQREKEILEGAVQSYGVGTRNASRFGVTLDQLQKMIKTLEDEIDALEGNGSRKAVGVIPRDW